MKAALPNVKLSLKKSENRHFSATKTIVILAVIGCTVGACGTALVAWNEDTFGAQVSSYRFGWFTALAAPGTALASSLTGEDRQLGSTGVIDVLSIALLNGICYLLASLFVMILVLLLKRRS